MSLLKQKQQKYREERANFEKVSKRSAFTSIILLLFLTAVIALIALIIFYSLNCPSRRALMQERVQAVERYNLSISQAGGCVGPPTTLFTDGSGSSHSVTYLLGSGDIKPWQYVGDFPIHLYYHQGGALNIHLLDPEGNYTMEVLGDVNTDSTDTNLIVKLPALHWHAWEPKNLYPLTILSVVTSPGTSDFSQHPLADINTDPVLSLFLNSSDTMLSDMVKYSQLPVSDYCLQAS